jgi:hypothetical protein
VVAILLSLVVVTRRTTGGGYSSRRVPQPDPSPGSQVEETDVDPGR